MRRVEDSSAHGHRHETAAGVRGDVQERHERAPFLRRFLTSTWRATVAIVRGQTRCRVIAGSMRMRRFAWAARRAASASAGVSARAKMKPR